MKKILICTQSVDKDDPIAGFFSPWIVEFAKNCDSVTVLALSGQGAEKLPVGIKVLSLEKENNASKLRQLFLFYKYIFQERSNYDTVFVHNVGPKFVILGTLLWRVWSKKIALWYVHGSVDWKLCIAEKLVDIAFSSAPETFRVKSKKINFLGHGIDVDALGEVSRESDPNYFSILQVSRMAPRKHADVLINALPKFSKLYGKPYKVVFIGPIITEEDEAYVKSLKERVVQLGLQEKVSFVGGTAPSDLPKYYAQADVTVNTSTTGGVDKVALESLAIGVPVITTFSAFNNILGPLADEYVLPELHDGTGEELSRALFRIATKDTSPERSAELKRCVGAYASLRTLIKRIVFLLYGDKG